MTILMTNRMEPPSVDDNHISFQYCLLPILVGFFIRIDRLHDHFCVFVSCAWARFARLCSHHFSARKSIIIILNNSFCCRNWIRWITIADHTMRTYFLSGRGLEPPVK